MRGWRKRVRAQRRCGSRDSQREVGVHHVEREQPARREVRAHDRQEALDVLPRVEVHERVERADHQREALARARASRKSACTQLDARVASLPARRRARQRSSMVVRGVDADDRASRRAPAAAACAPSRSRARGSLPPASPGRAQLLRGQLLVPADIVAAPLVLVVVERGVFVVLARPGGERGGEPLVKGHAVSTHSHETSGGAAFRRARLGDGAGDGARRRLRTATRCRSATASATSSSCDAAARVARALGAVEHRVGDRRSRLDRRLGAHRARSGGAQGSRRSTPWAATSRSPTCRRATRSSCATRWPGPRCSARAISSPA